MDRIAIISDIHGNLEALIKVLEDIKSRNIDKIYCIGDILAKGTHQQECLDLIRRNCEVVIKGNCDDYYTGEIDELAETPTQMKLVEWNLSKINDESKEYIRTLPYCYEFYLSGRLVRLIHSHPVDINRSIGYVDIMKVNSLILTEMVMELFRGKMEIVSLALGLTTIWWKGHIHTPSSIKIYNRYIINTGSVGNAIDVFRNPDKDGNVKNTTVANYLILSGNLDSKNIEDTFSYELVSLSYDIEKEINDNKDNIDFDSYSSELRNSIYRDMNKVYYYLSSKGINKEDI